MATKKELTAEILSLDANANIDADATHDDLTEQLRAVKATLEDLQELAKEEPKPVEYHVAKGKAITTSAGIKVGGDEITARMVTGGADKLKLLKSKGHLV